MKEHAKKALKHDFEVAGKTIPTLAVAVLFLIGTGSAALLSSFGTVSGTADVQQAVTVDGPQSVSYDAGMTAGATKIDTFNVTNDGGVSAPVDFTTDCTYTPASGITTDDVQGSTLDCTGVTRETVEYYDSAGSNFSEYSVPKSGVYVNSSNITEELSDGDGETLIVLPGDYSDVDTSGEGKLKIQDSGETLVAANAPDSDNPVTITSSGQNFRVAASGVTVKGFNLIADEDSAAIYLESSADNVELTSNRIVDNGGNPPEQSNNAIRAEQNTATISNNHIEGFQHGVLIAFNPETSDHVEIKKNTFSDMGLDGVYVVGKDGTQSNHIIVNNTFKDVKGVYSDGSEIGGAVLLHESTGTIEDIQIEDNNFLGSQVADVATLGYDSSSQTVDASNNWFGENGIQASGDVSASYEEVTSETLSAGETDTVGIYTNFDVALAPGDYDVDFNVQPSSATQ